jgi:release factor glutamine methyltransferase
VPRPETEELLELVLSRAVGATRVLDLGTGSGALALALAQAWPEARVTAVEASAEALALARENANALGLAGTGRVEFIHSDWFAALPSDAVFDLIVSNPPYLTDEEVAEAEPEVRLHDPRTALVAPKAGLADLEKIIVGAARRLAPGGWLALETGIDQHPALLASLAQAGLVAGESRKDLSGRNRFVLARSGAETPAR